MNIAYLADHKESIPTLARWFYAEWVYLYTDKTLEDVERLLRERTNKEIIPVTLVVLAGKKLIGSVSLKVNDMDSRLDLTPWLAGLYVAASKRNKEKGAMLIEAIEKKARELGVQTLYLYTP